MAHLFPIPGTKFFTLRKIFLDERSKWLLPLVMRKNFTGRIEV